jgi:NAD(P)-dependent dehydrogenase (short-subunit alcohol dehydrogenase family)
MDLQLNGKRALVTGGSRGIGKAIARVLAQEGVDVALLARGRQALGEAAEALSAETGRRVVGVVADTTVDAQVRAAVADAVRLLGGPIDILVNAAAEPAGFAGPPRLAEITGDFFHAEMDTKVMGYLRCAREVAPGMRDQGWGRIVNISGLAARQTGNAVGSMRNVAVSALTKNLADELGPFGINVTCIHPGLTWTEFMEETMARQAESRGETLEQARERLKQGNSVQQIITAEDIASLAVFLASPLSVAVTGETIGAGGGVGRAIYY